MKALSTLNYEEMADYASLVYINDDEPGYTRARKGKGFAYYDEKGNHLKNDKLVERLSGLGVPPAYNEVWYCQDDRGHLQATGINAQGKKQYFYHPQWEHIRDRVKFNEMVSFGEQLPAIRRRVNKALNEDTLTKEKLAAVVIKLLDVTSMRIGNDEYAKENNSYGLTTLRKKHVDVSDQTIHFEFKGKSEKVWDIEVEDEKLAEAIQACEEIPGYRLFSYFDDQGERCKLQSQDVNDYLKQLTGENFTAKTFRTWNDTTKAVELLKTYRTQPDADEQPKRLISAIVKEVAASLRNTPSVCRKSYIHPGLIEAYLEGRLNTAIEVEAKPYFSKVEATTLVLLKKGFANAALAN